jgi:hypothetical protein
MQHDNGGRAKWLVDWDLLRHCSCGYRQTDIPGILRVEMYQPERKYEAQSARHVLNVTGKYSTSNRLVQNHIRPHFNWAWGYGTINSKWADPRAFLCQASVAATSCVLRVVCTGRGADCGYQAVLHKVHHRVHNSPKLIPIISRSNSDRAISFDVCKTNFNISIASNSRSWKCSL